MKSIYAKTIYTGNGVLKDSVISFDKGKVKGIEKGSESDGAESYDCITPAFIDPHCHIGMIRSGEPGSEAEANEQMDSILAYADALDSVQMDDTSFDYSIENGVLYSCVVPGSGNLIGGASAVIRNYGRTTTDALITRAGIKGAVGYNPMSTKSWKGTRATTRMGSISILRQKLHEVRQKMEKEKEKEGKDEVTYTAPEDVIRSLLKGEQKFRVHVHKIDDIASLLRVVDEFGLTITVEHTSDVYDSYVFKELKKRNIPVVYGPMDSLAYKVELKHEHWKNAKHLLTSGVEFGLMTDHPVILQNMLLHQLRWFIRLGMSKEDTIGIITRKNAEILGIDGFLGTLETGKWASFTGWNGDPFDMTKYPVGVFGEGKKLYSA